MCEQAEHAPVVMYAKAAKSAAHGKRASKSLRAKTQKLADFSVSGGFDVPDHPLGGFPARVHLQRRYVKLRQMGESARGHSLPHACTNALHDGGSARGHTAARMRARMPRRMAALCVS